MKTDILPDQRHAQDHKQNLVRSRPWRIVRPLPPFAPQTRAITPSSYLPQRDREPSRLRVNRWRLRNPERQRASAAVARALANYNLTRKTCERCGTDKNVCADEIVLDPKLTVIWRCRTCINARRRALSEGVSRK
jgi:hypothetical protein